MMKTCSRCGEDKPSEAFYPARNKSGLTAACRPCTIAAVAANRRANPAKYAGLYADWRRDNKAKLAADGRAYRKKRRAEDRETVLAGEAARRGANRTRILAVHAAWRRANPGKVAEYGRRYSQANPEKGNARTVMRQAAKLRRTPPWLNQAHLAEIDGVYHFVRVMRQITGGKYEVDHVEPLQGRDVSGLHVPWNLRAIPARENRAKGNRRIENHG